MRGSAGSRWGELVSDSWRSLVGALWLSEQLGGVSWRTCLADLVGGVSLWRCGFEPRLIGTLGCEDRQVTDRVRRSPGVGALCLAEQLGGVSWRCQLAVSVGGPRWRSRLWRCGIEPRMIGTLRCEDRQVADRVRRSPAVGALWLALSDCRRNLAVSVGGPTWRTSLAVSPVAVRD